jgi:hypothetical protein
MGITPQAKSAVSSALFTAAELDPEPISKAVLAVAALFSKFFGFGYNPRKLADTAITEAVKGSLNILWYNLTGEALDGVNRQAEPGQYGKERIALFAGSAYPNVPYPAGHPAADLNQIRSTAEQIIAQGRSNLVRRESFEGYDNNASYMLGLMDQVASARAQQRSESPLTTAFGAPSGVMSWLPWLIGGYALYEFVL